MKRLLPAARIMLAIAFSFFLSGCLKDNVSHMYTLMRPVYESKQSVLENMKSSTPRELESAGKIFIQGRYIFLNELNKGVHIIDNLDPEHPAQVAFIDIPGNVDIAVKGTTLYADMYRDLVVMDISDPLNSTLIKTIPNVFPSRFGQGVYDSIYVIVGWEKKDTLVDVADEQLTWWREGAVAYMSSGDGSKGNYVPGMAGSLARFSIVNDYLYVINDAFIQPFHITDPRSPKSKEQVYVGWDIETLYPFQDKLFVGSATGMYIYTLDDPAKPAQVSSFAHVRACDPVITDGDYAYVTLRSGNVCNGFTNQLEVLNVTNIYSPTLVKTYPFTNPAGLAKDGNTLFICDGSDGLKVLDASDVNNLQLIKHITGINATDVIAWNNRLMMVSLDGLYQYDYSDLANIRQLSKISVHSK